MEKGGSPAALAERLTRLQRVTDAALAHLALDDLLDELLERLREIFSADTSAVLLLDEQAGELVARAAKGLEEEVERGVRIPLGRGFAGRVAAERRTIAIEDVDHADIYNPILREKGVKSLLGAPLIARRRVLGVLHVGTLSPRTFDAGDVDLIQLAAERAAMGIDKALAHEELRRLDELRHRIVSTASHELRTPVTSILGVATTLDRLGDQLGPAREAELKRVLLSEATRLATLVDQLLDLSRLEAHGVAIDPQSLNLRERVQATVDGIHAAHDISVEIDEALEIDADPVAFDRIVTNLVMNAVRHGSPPITIRAEPERGTLRLVVEDRGRGVPPEFRSQLFEQFTRSDASLATVGSGLGLAIARSYAQAHGGDLLYEDAQPCGARFALVLPAA